MKTTITKKTEYQEIIEWVFRKRRRLVMAVILPMTLVFYAGSFALLIFFPERVGLASWHEGITKWLVVCAVSFFFWLSVAYTDPVPVRRTVWQKSLTQVPAGADRATAVYSVMWLLLIHFGLLGGLIWIVL